MMEDFSGLALPPLFGGHILEAELEPGGVELGPGEVELGPGGNELLEGGASRPGQEEEEERKELNKRKCLALSRWCKEVEQVNEKLLGRLHQVQALTRRMKKERRFLMKTLDAHGDDYRHSHLTIVLEDESSSHLDSLATAEDERLNGIPGSSPPLVALQQTGPKKKRHRVPKLERERDPQTEADMSQLAEAQFGEFPSPTSLSH
ncbi:TCF3 fusion partner isoform X2 [Osmerus eperlanus]